MCTEWILYEVGGQVKMVEKILCEVEDQVMMVEKILFEMEVHKRLLGLH